MSISVTLCLKSNPTSIRSNSLETWSETQSDKFRAETKSRQQAGRRIPPPEHEHTHVLTGRQTTLKQRFQPHLLDRRTYTKLENCC